MHKRSGYALLLLVNTEQTKTNAVRGAGQTIEIPIQGRTLAEIMAEAEQREKAATPDTTTNASPATQGHPSFKTSRFEADIIDKIIDRTMELVERHGVDYDRMTAYMDIMACHANGRPLDLNKLLNAPSFDFSHDVFGIARHIDRRTGALLNCFVPRCSI